MEAGLPLVMEVNGFAVCKLGTLPTMWVVSQLQGDLVFPPDTEHLFCIGGTCYPLHVSTFAANAASSCWMMGAITGASRRSKVVLIMMKHSSLQGSLHLVRWQRTCLHSVEVLQV